MTLKLTDDKIAVIAEKLEEKTDSGFYIPEGSSGEKPFISSPVVLVGPGRRNEAGDRVDMDIAVGDEIYFHRHTGQRVEIDDTEYIILRPGDILGTAE
jgi:chaperonin GroES